MPIYDYLCSSCASTTEVIHGISAPGPRFCPVCGAEGTLRKAFVAPTVHFKGSGWAKKDRSSSSTKARAKSESGAEAAPSKSTPGDGSGTASTSSSTSGASSNDSKPGGSSSTSSDATAG